MRFASGKRRPHGAVLAGLLVVLLASGAPAQDAVEPVDEAAPTAAPEPQRAAEAPGVRVVVDTELIDSLVFATEVASFDALRERLNAGAWERRMALRKHVPESMLAAFDDLMQGRFTGTAGIALLQLAGLALASFLTVRLLLGRGDLAVSIEYPGELRGTFWVHISRRKAGGNAHARITNPAAARRAKRRAAAASRNQHPMVSRETRFGSVAAGRWYVRVEGFVQVTDAGEEVLSSFFEEQPVRVRRGHTERLAFDFHPRDCPLDVKVLWDRRPATEALVALRGVPGSARYTRGAPVRIGISRGQHTLVVGSADRVAELGVDVQSYEPTSLVIELTDREHVLFTGCPPAVEPYLHGDVPAAARALARDGQHEASNLLLGRFHKERNQPEVAARHYEEAGNHSEAADLYQSVAKFDRAAELYDQAGQTSEAAVAYRSAGNWSRAGEAFERAEQFDSAVECFRAAGDNARWFDALEKQGAHFEAADVAIESGDWQRAILSLEQIKENDERYLEASRLLADAYRRAGKFDLAARKLEQVLASPGAETLSVAHCERLARLHEDAGRYDRAAEVLEMVRDRDATFPNLDTRIEELRKRRDSVSAGQATAVQGDLGSESGSESRYEILDELGRGGMGVVFKARDRRLGRVIALKQLTESLRDHPKAVELFLREARAAAALNHPNIVTLHDAGQESGSYYLTMELLEGHPLRHILRSRGRLSARDVSRLGMQAAGALGYAHDRGIIHRDIKTANLFVTEGRALKIMDFGLAKMVEEVRRATTLIGGTPYYMAPEQSLGKKVDSRADLYALGVTLFELLTGAVPFREGDVAYHHRHTPPPDPREKTEMPDALAELVMEMMAKAPEGRPDTAEAVGERLQSIVRSLR